MSDNGVLWDDPDSPEARRCLAELKQLTAELASESRGAGFSGPTPSAGVPASVPLPSPPRAGAPTMSEVVKTSEQGPRLMRPVGE